MSEDAHTLLLNKCPGARQTYNENWLIERHGHRSPDQFRRDQMDTMPLAA